MKPISKLRHADPYPVGKILEVGAWANEKHELLRRYVNASWAARHRFPNRAFVDLFCGPGRVRMKTSGVETDGGAVVAWREASAHKGAFDQIVVGDVDQESLASCGARLRTLGAPVQILAGEAEKTVDAVLKLLPQNGLHLAYLDPFNLGHLPFSVIQKLATFKHIDIVVHLSVMDLQREIELDFNRDASRLEVFAPGWREHVDVGGLTKQLARVKFVEYWLQLVAGLGFDHSKEMPLMSNSKNGPLYRLMFLMRHPLAAKLWKDIARGQKSTGDLFDT